MTVMHEPSRRFFPVVHEVWAVVKVPGKFKKYGVFVDAGDAFIFREDIKYEVDCAKIVINDRRL